MENLKIKIEKHKEIYTFSYDFGKFSLIKWNDSGIVSLHDFSVKEKRKAEPFRLKENRSHYAIRQQFTRNVTEYRS